MKPKINAGIIGIGRRGKLILDTIILPMDDVNVLGVCDSYADRAEYGRDSVEKTTGKAPLCTTDYRKILDIPGLDAIFILTSWESHIDIAVEAMQKGIYVGLEVGGAFSVEDCWSLVRTYEQTEIPCMMLENCCYGKYELMVLNMVELGLLGEIVHCAGGYCHDLREQVVTGLENRHYRFRNYLNRNGDNYPTHDLGPIAKVLRINRGNRMMTLSSVGAKSAGLNEYIKAKHPEKETRDFAQSDIVTTIIKCSGGQTITLSLDTTLPRAYSRNFTVRGTKGAFFEDTLSVFIDGEHNKDHNDWTPQWGNAKGFYDKFKHPVWDAYEKEGIKAGHGGMDWLVFRAFVNSVKEGTDTPIDTYDTASWMSITALTERSVLLGGTPVEIPDFTNGKWLVRNK